MAIKTDQIVLLKAGSRVVATVESGQEGELILNGVEFDPVVRAADIDSGDATVGKVLTADGDGGVTWEDAEGGGGGGGLPTIVAYALIDMVDGIYDPPSFTVIENTFVGLDDEDITFVHASADSFTLTIAGEVLNYPTHYIEARTATGRPVLILPSGGGATATINLLKYDGTALGATGDVTIRLHIAVTKASA